MNQSLIIFLQFLKRDFYVHLQDARTYIINFILIQPVIWAFCFAYLERHVTFTAQYPLASTLIFSGSILIALLIITYKTTISLLYDFETERFIDYQISILHPRLVLLERILFTAFLSFLISVPFFPIGKLVAGTAFITTTTSWIKLYIIIALSALCCSAYNVLAICILKNTRSITNFWARINMPLMNLGGVWIPLSILKEYSIALGYVLLLNPFIYISEGVRSAVVGGPDFMPFWLCASMLLLFSALFTCAAWYFFKQRVDHI